MLIVCSSPIAVLWYHAKGGVLWVTDDLFESRPAVIAGAGAGLLPTSPMHELCCLCSSLLHCCEQLLVHCLIVHLPTQALAPCCWEHRSRARALL